VTSQGLVDREVKERWWTGGGGGERRGGEPCYKGQDESEFK
jgi:hypothetical protein